MKLHIHIFLCQKDPSENFFKLNAYLETWDQNKHFASGIVEFYWILSELELFKVWSHSMNIIEVVTAVILNKTNTLFILLIKY